MTEKREDEASAEQAAEAVSGDVEPSQPQSRQEAGPQLDQEAVTGAEGVEKAEHKPPSTVREGPADSDADTSQPGGDEAKPDLAGAQRQLRERATPAAVGTAVLLALLLIVLLRRRG